jgi:hypothetical protein
MAASCHLTVLRVKRTPFGMIPCCSHLQSVLTVQPNLRATCWAVKRREPAKGDGEAGAGTGGAVILGATWTATGVGAGHGACAVPFRGMTVTPCGWGSPGVKPPARFVCGLVVATACRRRSRQRSRKRACTADAWQIRGNRIDAVHPWPIARHRRLASGRCRPWPSPIARPCPAALESARSGRRCRAVPRSASRRLALLECRAAV